MSSCHVSDAWLAAAKLVNLQGTDECEATHPYEPAAGCGAIVGCVVGPGGSGDALRVTAAVLADQGRCTLSCGESTKQAAKKM